VAERLDDGLADVVARLRALPPASPRLVAAVLGRVRGRRPAPWRATLATLLDRAVPVPAVAALLLLALGVGYAGRMTREPAPLAAGPALPAGPGIVPVARDLAAADAPIAVQFVLSAPGARRVALVGDFNAWAPDAHPLVDPTGQGAWEVTVPLPPGRHVYGFLVDGERWVADPRAPRARDDDFGREGSVVLVYRP
jgi:hypothetical protein